MNAAINLHVKLSKITELWTPKIVARMNDYHFKLTRLQGDFIWHSHQDTDEVFLVLEGELTIHLQDGDARVRRGEMIVIPKGVRHKPSSEKECHVMLVEKAGTVNTGDAGGDRTASSDSWI